MRAQAPFTLAVGCEAHTSPYGGRPSDGQMPAFSLRVGASAGVVWMVGWSGNWQQDIWRDRAGVRIRIASATSTLLARGDTVILDY